MFICDSGMGTGLTSIHWLMSIARFCCNGSNDKNRVLRLRLDEDEDVRYSHRVLANNTIR